MRWYPAGRYLWFFEYGHRDIAHARNDRGQALCDARMYISPFRLPGLPLLDIYERRATPCPKCQLIISNQEGR